MLATICLRKYLKRFFFCWKHSRRSSTTAPAVLEISRTIKSNLKTNKRRMRKAGNLLITKLKALMPRLEIPIALISFGASDYFLIPTWEIVFRLRCCPPVHKGHEKGRRKLIVRIVFTKYNIAFKANEIRFVFCWWRISFRSFQSLSKLTMLRIYFILQQLDQIRRNNGKQKLQVKRTFSHGQQLHINNPRLSVLLLAKSYRSVRFSAIHNFMNEKIQHKVFRKKRR